MTDKIKEKLLKEKNEIEDDGCGEIGGDRGEYTCLGKGIYLCILCRERLIELEAQLQQHEETSKAKDKEFINILNDLQDDVDTLQKDYANLDECEKIDVYKLIEEIKQYKLMEKE